MSAPSVLKLVGVGYVAGEVGEDDPRRKGLPRHRCGC